MLNATLVKKISITENLCIICVKPDDGIPDFLPGQYVALGLSGSAPRADGSAPDHEELKPDKIIKRTYSIGSSPTQKDYYEFYLAIVPTGTLTPRLAALKEGDRLFCAAKVTGKFTLDSIPATGDLALIATGTGIAPFIAMLRTPDTWKPNRRIQLIYGARYSRDLAYTQELSELTKAHPEFSYHLTISREDPAWKGARGYVQNYIKSSEFPFNHRTTHFMLCGNPAMVEDVEKLLIEKGCRSDSKKEPGNIHVEKYW